MSKGTLGKPMKKNRAESVAGYGFIAPACLHLLVFALLPIAYALWLSFFKWDLFRDTKHFVGLQNYAQVVSDQPFWSAVKNSLLYAGFSVPIGLAFALFVAVFVTQRLRGMAIFRTLFYIPAISSQVAIAMVWIYVFLPETGLINTLLASVGLPNSTDFLNEVAWAMPALIFMSIWVGLGPRMILFAAGILNIPTTLYEAASLDGASGLRQFFRITLPLLSPTTLFVLVTGTIASLQLFTPVYLMTKGGPVGATDVVGYHVFTTAWRDFQVGKASAQSFFLLSITAFVAFAQFRLMKSQLEGSNAN